MPPIETTKPASNPTYSRSPLYKESIFLARTPVNGGTTGTLSIGLELARFIWHQIVMEGTTRGSKLTFTNSRSSSLLLKVIERVIERATLEEAAQILEASEEHMIKVFESIGMVSEARHVAELVAYVRAHSFLTSDHLFKLVQNVMTQKDFDESLKAAVRAECSTSSNGRSTGSWSGAWSLLREQGLRPLRLTRLVTFVIR